MPNPDASGSGAVVETHGMIPSISDGLMPASLQARRTASAIKESADRPLFFVKAVCPTPSTTACDVTVSSPPMGVKGALSEATQEHADRLTIRILTCPWRVKVSHGSLAALWRARGVNGREEAPPTVDSHQGPAYVAVCQTICTIRFRRIGRASRRGRGAQHHRMASKMTSKEESP